MSFHTTYASWDSRWYVDYFRKSTGRNVWFLFATFFFLVGFGYGCWIAYRHLERIPEVARGAFLCSLAVSPLPLLVAFRQHRALRRLLGRQRQTSAANQEAVDREYASGLLKVLWLGYWVISLLFTAISLMIRAT
jgi:pimeloyl-ACP methyl ester carboxylesterase